jgi:hypothetical protein
VNLYVPETFPSPVPRPGGPNRATRNPGGSDTESTPWVPATSADWSRRNMKYLTKAAG